MKVANFICRGCSAYHHPHDPCAYIKAQVPAETTLDEVKKMLKSDKILSAYKWLMRLRRDLKKKTGRR